jgi:uncharacterized membrane protein YGL010W
MADSFVDKYKARHRHPLNKLSHSIGIPLIVGSLVLFVVGWAFQFLGHAIEGNQPAFFRNPFYLLVGPWWLVRRAAEGVGLSRPSKSK